METISVKLINTNNLTWQSAKLLEGLTDDDINQADRYLNEDDKVTHLVSAYLKRKYIWNWEVSSSGKPIAQNICFNISHTKGAVVFVEAPCDVGIDIEYVRPADEDLRRYISSNDEYDFIKDDLSFYKVWTSKESLAKAEGQGISHPNTIPALPLVGEKEYKSNLYYSNYVVHKDYVISVTIKTQNKFLIELNDEKLTF